MNEIIITAITSVATIVATVLTVWSGNKLTAYRIEQLEEKVSKHNNLITRMYDVEKRLDVDENRISVSEHRIKDLEVEERAQHEHAGD